MENQSKVAQLSEAIRTVVTLEDSIHASPVNAFPNEVLCSIFEWVKIANLHSEESGDKKKTTLEVLFRREIEWVSVTYVCRRWRDIAIANSTLWTSPPMLFPTWAREMFKRSRSATIRDICIDYTCCTPDVIAYATEYMPRTRNLGLYYCHEQNLEVVVEKLRETPNTVVACLSVVIRREFSCNRDPDWKSWLLPEHVLCKASQLRTLKLSNTDINWSTAYPASITDLRLLNISMARRPTIAQLRLVLGRMPQLRTLVLLDALPEQNPDIPAANGSSEKIVLEQVESLTIGGTSFELKDFIFNFATSGALSSVTMMVSDEGQDANQDLLGGCQMALTDTRPAFSQARRLTVETYDTKISKWKFLIPPAVSPSTEGAETEEMELMVEIAGLMYVPHSQQLPDPAKELRFKQLFETVHWHTIDQLDLTGLDKSYHGDVISSQAFADTFGSLKSIREVVAAGWSVLMMLDIFSTHPPVEGADCDDNSDIVPEDSVFALHPFSGIKQLHFKSVAFCEDDTIEHVIKFDDFLEAFSSRKKLSMLPALILDCVGLSPKDVDALKEFWGFPDVPQPGQEEE